MPTITNNFVYNGRTQTTTIPAGATQLEFWMWGGGGGGGGGDASGPGRPGAAGHYVHAVINLQSPVNYVGSTLSLVVGSGGEAGSSGGGAPGGAGGQSLTGYSGGRGGTSGPRPYSGAGGGGGGASLIKIGATVIALAGGGGGGGGDALYSQGTAGINSNSATAGPTSTLGENGANHGGDGGAGGAGGGGAAGGKGGNGGQNGDNGGTGGYSGSNIMPSTVLGAGVIHEDYDDGSGQVPKDDSSISHVHGGGAHIMIGAGSPGYGGTGSIGGRRGWITLVWTVSVEGKFKQGGAWKSLSDIYFKKGLTWKKIQAGYIKVGGVWKALWSSIINFIGSTAGMGDATGNPASGLVGTDAPRVYQYVSYGGDGDGGAADSCDADADGNDDADDGGADDSGD
jgi:hypothetical protein